MKETWNLVVFEVEVCVVIVVVGGYGILTVDLTAGDDHRLTAYLAQSVEECLGLFPRDTLHVDRGIGEVTGFGIVWEGEMGHRHHFAHQFHLSLGDTVIEPSAVAEDGVYKDGSAQGALFLAVASHEFRLIVAEHEACTDGVEGKSELFPHR